MADVFSELAGDIEHEVRGIVDCHPLTWRLPDVARRNMAYMAGSAAISALTAAEYNRALTDANSSAKGQADV